MTSFVSWKKTLILTALSATLAAAASPSAWAMPVGRGIADADHDALIQRTSAEQHRVYPGSDSAAAEKARADRNAPNMFCEKQENKCE